MIRMSINTEVRPADAEGIARAAELLRQGLGPATRGFAGGASW